MTVVEELRGHQDTYNATLNQENKAKKTKEAYNAAIDQFLIWLGMQKDLPGDVYGLERKHITTWIEYLQGRGLSEATVANRYRGLKSFFVFVEEEMEGMDRKREFLSPMRKMSMPKVHVNPVEVLAPELIEALMGTCKIRTFENDRDAAIIQLFYGNGVRKAEMLSMGGDKVNFKDNTFWVLGKNGRPRQLPMLPSSSKYMARYKARRSTHAFVSSPDWWLGRKGPLREGGLRRMVERRGALVGINGLHPHQFRHTWAHEMRLSGIGDDELMRLAGWEGRDMLHRYSASAGQARAITAARNHDLGARLNLPR